MKEEYSFVYILGRPDEAMVKAKKEKFEEEAEFNSILSLVPSAKPLYGYVIYADN